jgi:hypothetical protein
MLGLKQQKTFTLIILDKRNQIHKLDRVKKDGEVERRMHIRTNNSRIQMITRDNKRSRRHIIERGLKKRVMTIQDHIQRK